MKRFFVFALAAAVALVSCEKEGQTDKESEISDQNIFWGVVGNLVDSKNITPDYKGKTFKATIGSPDGGDESVRIVSVNDLGAAVSRFNILTGESITETTPFKDWRNNAVGRLTWTLSNDNTCWATVDVSIPAVPSLHKIIYRSPEQGNTNGSVGDNGSAYYRFGDVIKRNRQEDGSTEYWICVRPAFGPEGKAKSHWVSVSPLPMSHVWPYNSTKAEQQGMPFTASNGMEYGLPTLIGDDVEWHQDLAELLFAIMYPEEWYNNAFNFYSTNMFGVINGLRIFNDFERDNLKYHNKEFWKNVQQKWKAKNIVQTVFGVTYDEMAAALNPNNANARGLHLLYNGYSWNTTTSNKPKLYQLHYTSGEGDKEKNMHKQTKTTVSAQVVTPRNQVESNTNFPLNVFTLYLNRPYLSEARFFGDDKPRWIVRYATGEELSDNDRYDPQQPISGFTNNNEIYRYYKDVFPEKNLTDAPEITVEGGGYGYSGRAHYKWGNVYKDEKGDKWFVVNQAGNDMGGDDISNERSPYSELISFGTAGLTPTSNNYRVTNLPTLEQVMRCYLFLFHITSFAIDNNTEALLNDDPITGRTALNILRNAGVDVRRLMQAICAQDNDPRNASLACCIAYSDPSSSLGQTLLRCVVNYQNPERNPNMYFWTLYPSAPDNQTQFVQNFSTIKILLQDIADQAVVNKYAPDTYAVQPLAPQTKPDSDLNTPRSIRTQADNRARDIKNYYFDATQYNNLTYPGSMWNEPVLVFRYTRVKDQGDKDYSKTTVDGHTLTLVAERDWNINNEGLEASYEMVKTYATTMWHNLDLMKLNGQPYHLKTWQEIKDSEINSK